MVSEKYVLVRSLDPECAVDFDYLESVDESAGYTFTDRRSQALVLPSWEAFVAAATAIWNSLGPTDIFFERVYEIA